MIKVTSYGNAKYNLSNTVKTLNIATTHQHTNHNHQRQGNQGDHQNAHSLKLMDQFLWNL